MNRRQSSGHFLLFCLSVLVVAMRPAHAYSVFLFVQSEYTLHTDPGIGSYVIQIVIAAVVVGAVAFILRLLTRDNRVKTTAETAKGENRSRLVELIGQYLQDGGIATSKEVRQFVRSRGITRDQATDAEIDAVFEEAMGAFRHALKDLGIE